MAVNVPLELQSQVESQNALLEIRSPWIASEWSSWWIWAKFVWAVLPSSQMPHPRQSLECLFQDQTRPQELKASSLLAVQSRNSALLWSLLLQWEQQEGRQQLLLLTAFTNAHLGCMVASECLIKSSVGHVRATQMAKSLLWIYKMYSLKNCLRLGNQSKSFFLAIWSFSSSPNWTVITVCVMFCRSKALGWHSGKNKWDKGVYVPPFHMKTILLT